MKKTALTISLVVALIAAFGLVNNFSKGLNTVFGQSGGKNHHNDDGKENDPEAMDVDHHINPRGAKVGLALTTGGTAKTTAITNHGGPVITGTIGIYIIWYGNWNQTNGSDNATGKQIVRDFCNNIGNSPYFNINQSYTGVTGSVLFRGETTDSGTSKRLTDNNIQTIVKNSITSGRLPYDANGVYFLLTSSDVTASSGFCTQYCGWHTYANATSTLGKIRYSFVGNANRCLTSCAAQSTSPNGNPGVDGMLSVLAHELEEAASDPDLNAWYDSAGAENADKCAWTFGHFQFQAPNGSWANVTLGSRNYLIQRNLYHNLNFGGVIGDYCMMDATHN